MKIYNSIIYLLLLIISFDASSQTDHVSVYYSAMKLYRSNDYANAAKEFDRINNPGLSLNKLYDGACIYAMNSEKEKAFAILYDMAEKKGYGNFDRLNKDSDFTGLRTDLKWAALLEKVTLNSSNAPQKKLETIYTELNKAKRLLSLDAGKLWGAPIWNNHILVLDFDHTIYSITEFPGSKTDDGKLFYAHIPVNSLVFVNTVQSYQGTDYAIVMSNYLSDHSITMIHELFHLLQLKNAKLSGDAIKYLDNADARELLRLEYQALRNTLAAILNKSTHTKIISCLEDALLFRKVRQGRYSSSLKNELEIETLEGLANYTGFALSSTVNKYEAAIEEVYQRENAETYTRPFPYATGVAYGLIYDYLHIPWKHGLKEVYNFLAIYETKKQFSASKKAFERAKERNNFKQIHEEEESRRIKNEKMLAYYRNLLQASPVLKVQFSGNYGRTFNMNGTIEIPGLGTVFSSIAGRDKSGDNFGNFSTIAEKAYLGNAGIMMLNDNKTLVFPTPFKIVGNKILGETYEIELNAGWTVQKEEGSGNYLLKSN